MAPLKSTSGEMLTSLSDNVYKCVKVVSYIVYAVTGSNFLSGALHMYHTYNAHVLITLFSDTSKQLAIITAGGESRSSWKLA